MLAGTKLIAEAWDAAGLYQVGSFVGDGIVAYFGAIQPNPWQCDDAVHAALAMRAAIRGYNAQLARDIERMRDHIKRLESNPSEQELEIRQRLKLLKPGEKVYITGKPE